jgi:hypothetical protein
MQAALLNWNLKLSMHSFSTVIYLVLCSMECVFYTKNIHCVFQISIEPGSSILSASVHRSETVASEIEG